MYTEAHSAAEPLIQPPCRLQVPMSRLMALNRPEWHYGVVGFIAAAASGCAQPAVAFLMSGFITVFYLPDMVELRRQVGAAVEASMLPCCEVVNDAAASSTAVAVSAPVTAAAATLPTAVYILLTAARTHH